MNPEFVIRLDAEALGRLFMPRAGTFEVLQASVIQDQFLVDAVGVESEVGKCRLLYSEWEEDADDPNNKLWVSEYSIELTVGDLIAFGTYSTSFTPDQREAGMVLDQLKREAEDDFILCAKLLGRSVRRDLVIDEDMPNRPKPGSNLH
ncbi:MAG: hypothetical protein R3200_11990 [Xanthomonadales bacterium]|nr:hypothetical protein [Xanthomonadales bacterium]